MAVTSPDWLSRRGGALQANFDGSSWLVLLEGEPQYLLVPVPAAGEYSCQVTQTVNGRRLDSGSTCASPEEALQAGLEDLRQALGW